MTTKSSNSGQSWNPDYQKRDWEIVDYQQYYLPSIHEPLRGPALQAGDEEFFSCIGATQTYGIFVEEPFPAKVAKAINLPVLNLSLPAAGPGFYAQHKAIINYINRSQFLVLQVMSARAEPNRFYSEAGFCETVKDRSNGNVLSSRQAWQNICETHSGELKAAIQDSQTNWLESNKRLIKQITVPIILLWVSHDRKHTEQVEFSHLTADQIFFTFPQLIDANCLNKLKPLSQGFVACNSQRNYGHPLVNRFTGEPTIADYGLLHPSGKGLKPMTHNTYYPSPQIHEDISTLLLDEIHTLKLLQQ